MDISTFLSPPYGYIVMIVLFVMLWRILVWPALKILGVIAAIYWFATHTDLLSFLNGLM